MKGFANAQDAMMTLAVILIVGTSVAMTYVYLQGIKVPEGFEKTINGNANEVSSTVARHVSACYSTHKGGDMPGEDCYVLHIYTKDGLTKKDVLNKISQETVPPDAVSFPDQGQYVVNKNTNSTIKIKYDELKRIVIVKSLDDI